MCVELKSIKTFAFSECSSLSTLKLPEGLTSIGASAFSKIKISSLTIPSTVSTIEESSFLNCFSLTSVIFTPVSSLTILYSNSFYACPITQFTIPASVTTMSGLAFNMNPNLLSVGVASGSNSLCDDGKAIYNLRKNRIYYCASALSGEFTVPDGVIIIDSGCFCSSRLTKVILPSSVTSIQNYCFTNSIISSVNLPDSITLIGRATFYQNTGITTITLPSSLKTISAEIFKSSNIVEITIPEGVTKIDASAFANCQNLKKITLPVTLTELGGGVFTGSNPEYVFPEGSSIYIKDEVLLMDTSNTFISQYFGIDQTSVVIPSTVKKIRAGAFRDKKNLQSITSDGDIQVEIIEEYAFSGCISLRTIFDLSYCKSIYRYAFYRTAINQAICFGNNLANITEFAFSQCSNIPSISFSTIIQDSINFLNISNDAFSYCKSVTSLNFDECTVTINLGNNCFNGLEKLSSINIPNSINNIGYNCFASCGITKATIENDYLNCGYIPIGLFMNCTKLESFTIPNNVNRIGSQSLMNTKITSVNIPDTLTVLGQQCFKGCEKLNSVIISDDSNLERIDFGVFDGCVKLAKINEFKAKNFVCNYGALYNSEMTKMIVYPPASPSKFFALADTVKYIAESAFIGCINLQSVLIPDGTVESIGVSAFEGCVKLRSINIPICVQSIGENAFAGCKSLICGSIIFVNQTASFKKQLLASGLSVTSLSECLHITCRATYYSYGLLPLYVMIIM